MAVSPVQSHRPISIYQQQVQHQPKVHCNSQRKVIANRGCTNRQSRWQRRLLLSVNSGKDLVRTAYTTIFNNTVLQHPVALCRCGFWYTSTVYVRFSSLYRTYCTYIYIYIYIYTACFGLIDHLREYKLALWRPAAQNQFLYLRMAN
jgi:hypothetical protein